MSKYKITRCPSILHIMHTLCVCNHLHFTLHVYSTATYWTTLQLVLDTPSSNILLLSGNAYIMVPPKNTTANEGTRIKLTCQAEGFPNNITYRWYKNSEEIQAVPGLMTRAAVYADGSFVISTVIKEDTGWYKCRPSNGLGTPPEAQAYLNVTCKCFTTAIYTYDFLFTMPSSVT